MGLLDIFKRERLDYLAAPTGIAAPWADSSHLAQGLIWADVLGLPLEDLPLSRADALSIPAVARGRALIVSNVAPLPLRALDSNGVLSAQPTFLYRSDSGVSPYMRMVSTLDSLMMYGVALWAVNRGAKDQIVDAAWVPHNRWGFDSEGRILVDHGPVDASQVILFQSATPGLLEVANRTLKGAKAIEEAWVSKARNPVPLTVIKHVPGQQGDQLEQEEITELLRQWATARRNEDGALGYLPPSLTIETHGTVDPALYVEGRNAIRVDIASFLGIPASLLDGSVAEASLTYTTTEGNRNRFFTETLPLWTNPIESRLSEDDVVPRGQRVRFDFTELYTNPPTSTGAPSED
jgi:Phage portal protein